MVTVFQGISNLSLRSLLHASLSSLVNCKFVGPASSFVPVFSSLQLCLYMQSVVAFGVCESDSALLLLAAAAILLFGTGNIMRPVGVSSGLFASRRVLMISTNGRMAMLLMPLEALVSHATAPSCGPSSATRADTDKCASLCSYEARAKRLSQEIAANIDCSSPCSGKQQRLVELVEIEDQIFSVMELLAAVVLLGQRRATNGALTCRGVSCQRRVAGRSSRAMVVRRAG